MEITWLTTVRAQQLLLLPRPLHITGPPRLWAPLPGTVSHLNSALFHGIYPARFTSFLKLLFSPGPGLETPQSSYPEVALYKFHRWIDSYCLLLFELMNPRSTQRETSYSTFQGLNERQPYSHQLKISESRRSEQRCPRLAT